MAIQVGDSVPSGSLNHMTESGPEQISTDDLFSGKKVVVFALPGAFTPTCSAKHVPGFLQHAGELKAKGVDTIACLSVNDAFVMGAWGKDQGVGNNIMMLADGSAAYTKALGMELDLTAHGMGVRAKRFAMVVDNGKVSFMAEETNPGALEASSAEAVLAAL